MAKRKRSSGRKSRAAFPILKAALPLKIASEVLLGSPRHGMVGAINVARGGGGLRGGVREALKLTLWETTGWDIDGGPWHGSLVAENLALGIGTKVASAAATKFGVNRGLAGVQRAAFGRPVIVL